jgi:hypothetical protein
MQYCQLVLGYTPLQTALALTPLVVALTLLSGFSFWYLPKLGLRLVVFLGLSTMAVGFLCLHGLGLHSSYVELAWPLLVLSTGIGLCTAPATTAIMGAAPDEKQGVASGERQRPRTGGGTGLRDRRIHACRSVCARGLTEAGIFPGAAARPASDSLAKSVEVAHRLGPQGAELVDISRTAFLHAMQSSLYVMAGIVAVAAVVISLWSPGRDGGRLSALSRRRRTDASGH